MMDFLMLFALAFGCALVGFVIGLGMCNQNEKRKRGE